MSKLASLECISLANLSLPAPPADMWAALAGCAAVSMLVLMCRQAGLTVHSLGRVATLRDRPAAFAGPKPARKQWIFSSPNRVIAYRGV